VSSPSLAEELAFLQSQLHAINLALAQARARGDETAIVTLRALYDKLTVQAEQLKVFAREQDAPSDFLLALSRFSDETVATAQAFKAAAVGVASGFGTLSRLGPWILFGVVVILVLYYGRAYKVALSKGRS
jgi:hypothetical protein